jgi:hypothetical protein
MVDGHQHHDDAADDVDGSDAGHERTVRQGRRPGNSKDANGSAGDADGGRGFFAADASLK